MERWKEIPGYEGLYEASTKGRIRTKEGKTTVRSDGQTRVWKQRVLKNRLPKGRDVRVSLWKDGKHKDWLVHRLVAFTFIPTVEGKTSINHIDGNPKNNNVENLEWCNHYENNNHAFENGLMPTKRVALINSLTGEMKEFRSMAKASEFLGRNAGYVSGRLKKGRKEFGGYLVIILD